MTQTTAKQAIRAQAAAAMVAFCAGVVIGEAKPLPGLPGTFTVAEDKVEAVLAPRREIRCKPNSIIFLPYPSEMMDNRELAPSVLEESTAKTLLVLRQPGERRFLPPTGALAGTPIRTVEIPWERMPSEAAALDSFDCIVALTPPEKREALQAVRLYCASGGRAVVGLGAAMSLLDAEPHAEALTKAYTSVVNNADGTGVAWEGTYPGGLGSLFIVNTARLEETTSGATAPEVASALGAFLKAPGARTIISARDGRLSKSFYDAAEPLLQADDVARTKRLLAIAALVLTAAAALAAYPGGKKGAVAGTTAAAVLVIGLLVAAPPSAARVVQCAVIRTQASGGALLVTQVELLTGVNVHRYAVEAEMTSALPCRPLAYDIREIIETPFRAEFEGRSTLLRFEAERRRPALFYSCGMPSDAGRLLPRSGVKIGAALQPGAAGPLLKEIHNRLPENSDIYIEEGVPEACRLVKAAIAGREVRCSDGLTILVVPKSDKSGKGENR